MGTGRLAVAALSAALLLATSAGAGSPPVQVGVVLKGLDSQIDQVAARRAGMRIDTYIGTDDAAAGELAATEMVSVLGGHGEVALVGGYSMGSTLRLSAFTRGVAGTQIRIVARAHAGYDRGRAQLAARRILRNHPNVAGFFAANDVMALGIADAVQAAHKRGAVEIIDEEERRGGERRLPDAAATVCRSVRAASPRAPLTGRPD